MKNNDEIKMKLNVSIQIFVGVQEERTEQVFETKAKLRSHHEPIYLFIISPENPHCEENLLFSGDFFQLLLKCKKTLTFQHLC